MDRLLRGTAERAARYMEGLPARRVAPEAAALERLNELDGPLPDGPDAPERVIAMLDELGSPATMPPPDHGSSASSSVVPTP